jgi:hypothetical protein
MVANTADADVYVAYSDMMSLVVPKNKHSSVAVLHV